MPRSINCSKKRDLNRQLLDEIAQSNRQHGAIMGQDRLAAFSDGVIAIIITIMVLELHLPAEGSPGALAAVAPNLAAYVLSFIYVAIYWNNHHHLLHTVTRVDGLILWSNMHLLFWLSIIPAATGWIGHNLLVPLPTAVYGVVLVMPAIAYYLLVQTIIRRHGRDSMLAQAVGQDLKGKISVLLLAAGIGSAFLEPWVAMALYVAVAVIWIVPDRRIERTIAQSEAPR
jgi:uncharacterized membrane protein